MVVREYRGEMGKDSSNQTMLKQDRKAMPTYGQPSTYPKDKGLLLDTRLDLHRTTVQVQRFTCRTVILYFAHEPTLLSSSEIGVHSSAVMGVFRALIFSSLHQCLTTQYFQSSMEPALQRWCGHVRLIHLGTLDHELEHLRAEH